MPAASSGPYTVASRIPSNVSRDRSLPRLSFAASFSHSDLDGLSFTRRGLAPLALAANQIDFHGGELQTPLTRTGGQALRVAQINFLALCGLPRELRGHSRAPSHWPPARTRSRFRSTYPCLALLRQFSVARRVPQKGPSADRKSV